MRLCSQVCGVVFNPIEDDYVDVCEDCESRENDIEVERESLSFYLGKCGLIIDYLL
ncbi:hypothetical protein [Paenibacillus qinlingensis]|uniref:hypothetical protein n=1 Tax=Paenibacillus qinlingensis TaxID=1837343 RepID=UPI001564B1F1|nr:hypothetical protein [Paenibacillus qinlingensis]NQX57301.1 hypothetical protein [Paenibacillus qinlingensis]